MSGARARLLGPAVGRAASAAGATVLVAVALVLASVALGVVGPPVLLALQAMLPLLLMAGPVVGVVAAALRLPVLAGAAVVVTLATVSSVTGPAVADGAPRWAGDAPRLVVFSANVRFDNPRTADVVADIAGVEADVLVLNEMTPSLLGALDRAGVLDRYATRVVSAMDGGFGELVMTRRRAADPSVEGLGPINAPAATVEVGGRAVRVLAVHPQAPSSGWGRDRWLAQYEALTARASQRRGPMLLLGDFNASAWHAPFRDLLGAGLVDAHDARGVGLSRSWGPIDGPGSWFGPLLRIDHSLASPELAVVDVRDGEVPGSDHRSQLVTYAVAPPGSAG